jgi:type I restriction enzyme M protein
VFTKTGVGGTDHVWFYDVEADGWSLDDKRLPLLPEDKQGPTPKSALTEEEHASNNLADLVIRWEKRNEAEQDQPRSAHSFCVPKSEIAAAGYDLSLNRYKEVVREEVIHQAPTKILADLMELEDEIRDSMKTLEGMLQ